MARIICPFCLQPHDFVASSTSGYICPVHNVAVPDVYVREHSKAPPLWLVTVGFSKHGKTTYLAALTLMLENVGAVWDGVFYRALDQYTFDAIRKMHRDAMEGETVSKTPKALNPAEEVPRPLLFSLYNMPDGGSRCLVMYDVAGETYDNLSDIKYVTSIKQVKTTWLLVSLKDLQDDKEGKSITELFNIYLGGMEKLRIDLSGRNLIVVYTKADQEPKTKEIVDYLRSDPFQALTLSNYEPLDMANFSLREYADKMQEMSDYLETYTRKRVRGGAAFIAMVKASGMKLSFCVTSALGQSPDATTNRLSVNALRYRVLDPFLWAMALDLPTRSRPIALIADTSSEPLIQTQLVDIWERISDHGELEVTTYYLGQTMPVSQPGQRPPGARPRSAHQRLIGPLLENMLSKEQLVMVISAGRIMDLDDFAGSHWRDRLLLVSLGEETQSWPHAVAYRSNDDPTVLVDALLGL